MHSFLLNLSLFFAAIAKCGVVTGILPGIIFIFIAERWASCFEPKNVSLKFCTRLVCSTWRRPRVLVAMSRVSKGVDRDADCRSRQRFESCRPTRSGKTRNAWRIRCHEGRGLRVVSARRQKSDFVKVRDGQLAPKRLELIPESRFHRATSPSRKVRHA